MKMVNFCMRDMNSIKLGFSRKVAVVVEWSRAEEGETQLVSTEEQSG